jgi:nucleoside-diphosphate-sugar epimerase
VRIAIIGCGYVGTAMAKHWKSLGHTLTVTTRSLSRVDELRQFADQVIVLEANNFIDVLEDQQVVLLSMAPNILSEYEKTYLQTAKLLISNLNDSLKTILYTSSTSVYGDHQGASVDEKTPPKPENKNGEILLETEKILMQAAKPGLNVCILRLGEIIGPSRTIAERLKKMNGACLPGTGQGFTNLSPIQDIIAGLDFALSKSLSGIYNLCNDLHISRKQLYDQICSEQGLQRVHWDPTLKSPHSGNKIVSNAKIKSLGLCFALEFSL